MSVRPGGVTIKAKVHIDHFVFEFSSIAGKYGRQRKKLYILLRLRIKTEIWIKGIEAKTILEFLNT